MSDFDPRLHPDGAPGIAVAAMRAQWGDVEFENYVRRIGEQHEASVLQTNTITRYWAARGGLLGALSFAVMVLTAVGAFAVMWLVLHA